MHRVRILSVSYFELRKSRNFQCFAICLNRVEFKFLSNSHPVYVYGLIFVKMSVCHFGQKFFSEEEKSLKIISTKIKTIMPVYEIERLIRSSD